MKRHAKILATLGPASDSSDMIAALLGAGANAFRLNFSHGSAEDHKARVAHARNAAAALGQEVTLLQDLQGPKIRIGTMGAATPIKEGDVLVLDNDPAAGDGTRVCLPHPEILASLETGDPVYINDGIIRLEVTHKEPGKVTTVVRAGGNLSSRKGVNVPGRALPFAALTEKDKADLQVGLALGVDWVALSFVQRADDIIEAKKLIGGRASLMAKIETRAAIDNLESILAEADGLMIARGDLGVELPTEEVPPLQKRMIRMCREAGKPVVVATQMLESMVSQPIPTRAEASDVANAAYEGADCLMLSAESASGAYPLEAVATMARIIERVEACNHWMPVPAAKQESMTVADSVCAAACQMAEAVKAQAIVVFTETGASTLRVERWRPAMPIVGLTPHVNVARRMGLQWGVLPVIAQPVATTDEMVAMATHMAKSSGAVKDGDTVVIAAGVPFGIAGSTNMVRVVGV